MIHNDFEDIEDNSEVENLLVMKIIISKIIVGPLLVICFMLELIFRLLIKISTLAAGLVIIVMLIWIICRSAFKGKGVLYM